MSLCEIFEWAGGHCVTGTVILGVANIALVYYTARYVSLTNKLLLTSRMAWRPQLQLYGLISLDDCPMLVFQNNGSTSAFDLKFSIKRMFEWTDGGAEPSIDKAEQCVKVIQGVSFIAKGLAGMGPGQILYQKIRLPVSCHIKGCMIVVCEFKDQIGSEYKIELPLDASTFEKQESLRLLKI